MTSIWLLAFTLSKQMDNRYEITQDVRSQIKFLDELDKLEKKRHLEQEREILMKAAKVSSDPMIA